MWFPSSSRELRSLRCENTLAGTSFRWLWPRISESRLSRPVHEIRGVRVQHIERVGWVSLAVRKGSYLLGHRKRRMSLPLTYSCYEYVSVFETCIFPIFCLITARIIFIIIVSYSRTPTVFRVKKSQRTCVGSTVDWRDVSSSFAYFGLIFLLCNERMLYGFHRRMFVVTTVFGSQEKI
jgi:hypothetical protein